APVSAPQATPGKARRAPADADRERARRAAEAEAAALREMMRQPRKVLRAPEPEETPTTGTLHKPAGTKASVKKESEGKKVIKAADVSSSWSNDGRKKPSKADTLSAGSGRDAWRAGGKAGSRGSKGARGKGRRQAEHQEPMQAEFIAREIHVPETISVADLAHKMSVKA